MVRHRLSDESIRAALAAAGGTVTVAAQELGVARNSLYKRIQHMKADLHAARARRRGLAHWDSRSKGHSSNTSAKVESAQKSESAIYPDSGIAPTLIAVRDKKPRTPKPQGEDGRVTKSLWLRKDRADKVSRARRRLAAALDVDLTDSSLLERFIESEFDSWVAKQLPPRKAMADSRENS